jgi:uncharacterized protein YecT (DUF1311 family)
MKHFFNSGSKIAIFFILLIILTLSGCGSKTPSCADQKTTDLIKQICHQWLEEHLVREKVDPASTKTAMALPLNVTMIRTAGHDEKLGKYTCEAVLETTYSDQATKIKGFDAVNRVNIKYTSQLTDDKKQQLVELFGHLPLMQRILSIAYLGAEQQPAPAPSSSSQPAVAPHDGSNSSVEQSGICKGLDLSITVEQKECLSRKYAAADKGLNDTYKQLMARLDNSRKTGLKKEQVAWIKEKESKCAKAGKEMEGGTLEGIMVQDCHVQMTEKRLEYLKNFK